MAPRSLRPPGGVTEATEAAVPLEKQRTWVWMGRRAEVQHEGPLQCSIGTFVSALENKQFKRTTQNNNNKKPKQFLKKAKPVRASPFGYLRVCPGTPVYPPALPSGIGSATRQPRAGCGHGLCSALGTEGRVGTEGSEELPARPPS